MSLLPCGDEQAPALFVCPQRLKLSDRKFSTQLCVLEINGELTSNVAQFLIHVSVAAILMALRLAIAGPDLSRQRL